MSGIDSYTKLLLHCDGVDGSQTFTDSATGKTITAVGNAQIDTAQKKFGTGSALFDGTGDYLTTPDHADFNVGSGAFTFDWWIRFNSVAETQFIFDQKTGGVDRWYLMWYQPTTSLNLQVYASAARVINLDATWLPSVNTWYHVVLVRTGNTFKAFVDGSQIGDDVSDTSAIPNMAEVFYIAVKNDGTKAINGWIDEFRFSKGIARWTANFTPPLHSYGLLAGIQKWWMMSEAWQRHDRLWTPKGLLVPNYGIIS